MHAFVKRVFRRAAAPARRGSATPPSARPTLEALEDRQLLTITGIPHTGHLQDQIDPASLQQDLRYALFGDPRVQFVNNLYTDLLNRQPDAAAQGWEQILINGDNSTADSRRALRLQVANGFLHSDEYIRKFVGGLYSQEVGSTDPNFAADVAGLEGGTLTTQDLRANALASDAYFRSHGGTYQGWEDAVFMDLVGRHFSLSYQLDGQVAEQLNRDLAHLPLATALANFAHTVQLDLAAKTHRVQLLYNQFLNQPLTTPLDAAGQQLAQNLYTNMNNTEFDVMAQVLASDAYYAKGVYPDLSVARFQSARFEGRF
jgi:hypothetical protein